jgi:hypothetical protein
LFPLGGTPRKYAQEYLRSVKQQTITVYFLSRLYTDTPISDTSVIQLEMFVQVFFIGVQFIHSLTPTALGSMELIGTNAAEDLPACDGTT